ENPARAAGRGAQLLDRQYDEYLGPLGEAVLELFAPLATGVFDPTRLATVESLLDDLHRRSLGVRSDRQEAAHVLARLGPAARPALPALRLAAQDGDPVVRRAAAEALRKVEGEGPRP